MSVLDPGSDPWLAQIEEEISHLTSNHRPASSPLEEALQSRLLVT